MIRPFLPSDTEALLAVWYAASREAHSFLSPAFLARERVAIRDRYLPRAETWVFDTDEGLAGFVSMLGSEVGALFIHPDRQRRGIGTQLLDFVRARHVTLEVEVFEANSHGRAFYAAYGFSRIAAHSHPETGDRLLRLRLAAAG